jgi:putative metalloprotease
MCVNPRRLRVFLVVLCVYLSSLWTGSADAAVSERMVRDAWAEVCGVAEMDPLPLSIRRDRTPNAWVTNDESLTVTTGLMNILENEDEIFGILSHELGHVVLGHYATTVKNAVEVGLIAEAMKTAMGDSPSSRAAVDAGATLAMAGFSREQETEADEYAVTLAVRGGHDPSGIYTALERLARPDGGASSPSGFDSHPTDESRLLNIKRMIVEQTEPDFIAGGTIYEPDDRIQRGRSTGANTVRAVPAPALAPAVTPQIADGLDPEREWLFDYYHGLYLVNKTPENETP